MKNKKAKRRIKIYLLVILGLLAFIGYKIYYFIPKINANYQSVKKLQKEYDDLLEEEDTLSKDVIKLKDEDYMERFAREKYLYSKDGEIIIRITDE